MVALIAYIIKSVVTSGILYAYYQLVLRNKKLHAYNRFYLLAASVISLIMPLANFEWYDIGAISIISPPAATRRAFSFTTNNTGFYCIGAISGLLLFIMLLKIVWVYRIKKKHGYTRMGKVHFIETDNNAAPFSFLNNLFWRTGLSATDDKGEKILRHEMTHISQKHSYDKLFIQAIACVCWVNPFLWLIHKELNMVHEFMADAASIKEGDTGSFALMLLQSHDNGRYLDPSHYFFRSPVIRRLNMVASTRDTSYKFARKFLALPLLAILLILFSFSTSTVKAGPSSIQQMERAQKIQDEKRAQAGQKETMTFSAHTVYIRHRYWTLI